MHEESHTRVEPAGDADRPLTAENRSSSASDAERSKRIYVSRKTTTGEFTIFQGVNGDTAIHMTEQQARRVVNDILQLWPRENELLFEADIRRGCPDESWHGADLVVEWLRSTGNETVANIIAGLHVDDCALRGERPRFFVVEESARSPVLNPPGWQPIETAPKDMTPILCGHPDHGVEIRYGVAARDQNGGEYLGPELGCAPHWYFTHWMPLPSPPMALPAPPLAHQEKP